MSGSLLRLACAAAVAGPTVLAPLPAVAVPEPGRPVSQLLTDLQQLYRQAEQATETFNASKEKLKTQNAQVAKLDAELARARLALHDSRAAVGRLARQQYQGSSALSPYLRLLLARDPQHALDEGHVIGQLSRERIKTVRRLAEHEKKKDELVREARKALDGQRTLAERQKNARDEVRSRLAQVEKMLATLSGARLAELAAFEQNGVAEAQKKLVSSGALSTRRTPSQQGDRAVRYAVEQLGKPYEWGAQGPRSYDCSGLTSEAWGHAGTPIPRTSQEQWTRLHRIPLTELRPGDLVLYFPEATHVAMYLGDGMVVQAPRPGDRVKVSPIASNPILGAVRPDPKAKPLPLYNPPGLTPLGTRGTARPATST
ncbi:NlpC/P60 family protein [Streptomyces sp. NPDC054794]